MDVREKLVELLKEISYDQKLGWYDLWDMRDGAEDIADLLISYGVTVQDNTEISDELLKQLRNAPLTVLHEEPTIEVVQKWIPQSELPWMGEEIAKLCIRYMEEYADFHGYASSEKVKVHIVRLLELEKDGRIAILPQPPKGE